MSAKKSTLRRLKARQLAKQVVDYLFEDINGAKVDRLVLECAPQKFGGSGYNRDAIAKVIEDKFTPHVRAKKLKRRRDARATT